MQRLFFFKVTQSVADFNPQGETALYPRRKNLFFLPYRRQVTPQAARSAAAKRRKACFSPAMLSLCDNEHKQ